MWRNNNANLVKKEKKVIIKNLRNFHDQDF